MTFKGRYPRAAWAAMALALASPWAAAQSTAAAPAADGPAAKRVAIDPATGRVRPMELDDLSGAGPAAAARSAAPSAAAAQRGAGLARLTSRETVSPTGVRGMRVGAEHLNFTRVTRATDGTLSATCSVGESAEEHARHTAAIVAGPRPASIVRRAAVQPGARDVE